MKALISGATGFIGGHIALEAIKTGWEVSGLRRNPSATGHLGSTPIQWIEGNLDDKESLLRAMEGVDDLFHAAGFYPSRNDRRPLQAQVRYAREQIDRVIFAAAEAGVKRFIFTSSLTTIGHPPNNEHRLADERDFYTPGGVPNSAYYEAKLVMEKQVLAATKRGFPGIILNPTAVFGPGDTHRSLGGLLIAVAKGWSSFWIPATTNVVDVRDVARAHILAATSGSTGERYIIGGHNLTIREALTITSRVAKVSPPRWKIPLRLLDLVVAIGDRLPFLPIPANHLRAIRYWQGYNTTKAESQLDLHIRPFEATVRDSLDWFQEHGYL